MKPRKYTVRSKGGVTKIRRIDYNSGDVEWRVLSARCLARDGHKCVHCSSTVGLEAHHIVPLSRGGRNSLINLITLCHNCHKKRHKHMR